MSEHYRVTKVMNFASLGFWVFYNITRLRKVNQILQFRIRRFCAGSPPSKGFVLRRDAIKRSILDYREIDIQIIFQTDLYMGQFIPFDIAS